MKGSSKMDFYRFINSKDIRAHLESIGYQFDALEAAWLVCQCHTATMEEKHAAWREIIDTMPDMRVEFADESFESLHQLLRDNMAEEQRWFQSFVSPDASTVYEFEYFERKTNHRCSSRPFAEYNACISAMKKSVAVYKNGENSPIIIRKTIVDAVESNPSSVVVDPYGIVKENFKWNYFDDLWFAFPTPFQKSDIVFAPNGNEEILFEEILYDDAFVLTETATDIFSRTNKPMCDSTDMTAYGYFQEADGSLYEACMHQYMDLERYPEEKLTGKKRILKALGNHLKGEIDAVLFARAYHQILLEESARESLPRDITDEGMLLAGLKPNTIKEGEE